MEIRSEIGRGSFGIVYEGILDGSVVAAKIPAPGTLGIEASAIVEVAMLRLLQRCEVPHVMRLLTTTFVVDDEGRDHLALVMPLCEGSLGSRFPPEGMGLGENRFEHYVYPMLVALTHLHSFSPPIVHLDIKPENMMITRDDAILLSDFGSARFDDGSQHHVRAPGTSLYTAPEMDDDDGHWSTKSDVWSLGISAFEILNGMRLPTRRTSSARAFIKGSKIKRSWLRMMLRLSMQERCYALEALHMAHPMAVATMPQRYLKGREHDVLTMIRNSCSVDILARKLCFGHSAYLTVVHGDDGINNYSAWEKNVIRLSGGDLFPALEDQECDSSH